MWLRAFSQDDRTRIRHCPYCSRSLRLCVGSKERMFGSDFRSEVELCRVPWNIPRPHSCYLPDHVLEAEVASLHIFQFTSTLNRRRDNACTWPPPEGSLDRTATSREHDVLPTRSQEPRLHNPQGNSCHRSHHAWRGCDCTRHECGAPESGCVSQRIVVPRRSLGRSLPSRSNLCCTYEERPWPCTRGI